MFFRNLVRRYVPISAREPINRLLWRTGAQASYGAFGEDLVVRSWLESRLRVPASEIRYLDIGANHPSRLSNTYLLYRIGGSGVLIEPEAGNANMLRRLRPRDTTIEAGVAFDDRRKATFYEFGNSAFNTFDERRAREMDEKERAWLGPILRSREVPLIPVNEIFERHFTTEACHFMSVDAEGVDEMILAALDFSRFAPWIICIEGPASRLNDVAALKRHDYRLLAETAHNVLLAHPRVFAGS